MWMPPIEPEWQGRVEFWELVFGTWTSYAFLVLWWQKVLKEPLDEWRYAMLVFLGAGAFWVNHYFQKAPLWFWMINLYTVFYVIAWWKVAAIGTRPRSGGWKIAALASSLVYTVAFIAFEQLARHGVVYWRMHEFCWMAISFLGFPWLIGWRGRSTVAPAPAEVSPYPKPQWRGAGGNL